MRVEFGRYELISRIAVGGMAEVFRAKIHGAASFEKLVAIKRIHPSFTASPEFVNMFIDEAKIAASLSHGNITHIFDLGRVDDQYFIAMELVEGLDTRRILEELKALGRPGIPPQLATYIIAETCRGLHYAHCKSDSNGDNLGIIHRDISPSNVIVSFDGGVKIVDFGIAKAEHKLSRTRTGALKGKYCYLSPEAVRGQGIDQRSDIFSAGAVLYELLTSRRLFNGRSEIEILERIRDARFDPPSMYIPDLDPVLEDILLTGIEPNREQRFQTAGEFARALETYLHRLARPVSPEDLVAMLAELFPDGVLPGEEPLERDEVPTEQSPAGLRLPKVPALKPPRPAGHVSSAAITLARDEDATKEQRSSALSRKASALGTDFADEDADSFDFDDDEEDGGPTVVQARPVAPDGGDPDSMGDISTLLDRPAYQRGRGGDDDADEDDEDGDSLHSKPTRIAPISAADGSLETLAEDPAFEDALTDIRPADDEHGDDVISLDDDSLALIELVADQMSAHFVGEISEAPTYIGTPPSPPPQRQTRTTAADVLALYRDPSADVRRGFIGLAVTLVLAMFLALLVILTRTQPVEAPSAEKRSGRIDDDEELHDDDGPRVGRAGLEAPVAIVAAFAGAGGERGTKKPGSKGSDSEKRAGKDATTKTPAETPGTGAVTPKETAAPPATARKSPPVRRPGSVRKPPRGGKKKKPPVRKPPAVAPGKGLLTVTVDPKATVFVGGRSLGIGTTFKTIKLAPGRHKITLENSEKKLRKTLVIEVSVGEHHHIGVSGDRWHVVTKTVR